jgi:hypothetical protein
MTARFMRRSEALLAAEHLARAEAWMDEAAPELQADVARIRAQLLLAAGAAPVAALPERFPGRRSDIAVAAG